MGHDKNLVGEGDRGGEVFVSDFEIRICKLTRVIISAQAEISNTLKMRKHRL